MEYVTFGQLLDPMVLHNYINMMAIYMTLYKEREAAIARWQGVLITVKHSQLTCKQMHNVTYLNSQWSLPQVYMVKSTHWV